MPTFVEILDRLGEVSKEGKSYRTNCPAHDDLDHPSLTVSLNEVGTVLFKCWSRDCAFADIVEALGLAKSDCFNVAPGGDVVTTNGSGASAPPTAEQINWLREFIDETASKFADSPAVEYAKRWGITEAQAAQLRLGYTDTTVNEEWVPYPWTTVDRLTVPFYGFDGVPRGIQGRALSEDPAKWCSLSSPPENVWSRLGYFDHDHGNDYVQLGEGPGDALTAWVQGTPSAFLRGTTMAAGAINSVVAALRDRVVILAGDADIAGRKFNDVLGKALSDAGLDVRVLNLPAGIGDVTEWRERNPDTFAREYALAQRNAEPFDPTPPPAPRPTPPQQSFMRTIDGNARRLIVRSEGNLGFCPQLGRMVYEGGRWKVDELNRGVHWMSEMTFEMLDEGDVLINEGALTNNPLLVEAGEAQKSWAVRSQNQIFDDCIRRAEKLSSFAVDRLDTHPHLLNCKNGTLDLRTAVLRPHDRKDFLTHRLDLDFDPDATAPRWGTFLEEVFPDQPEMIDWLQRVCGYAATGETVEQCLLLCIGKGANGKSAFWNAISHVLKPLTGVVPFGAFEKKGANASTADLASLRGKRLCLVQEGEANTALAESTIKRATGGDEVPARNLYKAQMSYRPEFLIVMATNSAPRIRGADEGIWRRIKRSDWTRFFPEEERDPWLNQKLADEAQGILAWIVEGARQWYQSGLGDPPAVKKASRAYRHTSDELAGFCGLLIVEDPDGSISGSVLMGLYMDWCIEENVRAWSRRALYEAVVERVESAYKVKRDDGVHLVGVRQATADDWLTE